MLLLLTDFIDHQWRNIEVMIPQDLLISNNLAWSSDSTAALKAQQCLHFLWLLKKSCLDEKVLVAFCCSTIESILVYYVTVRYARCSAADEKAIPNILNTEKKTTSCALPSLEETPLRSLKENHQRQFSPWTLAV